MTRLLSAIECGDPRVAEQLLPLVDHKLSLLAARRLERERAGHTLEARALVHEASLGLAGPDRAKDWRSRGHFIAAAAQAMRHMLVENARRLEIHQGAGVGARRTAMVDEERFHLALERPPSERSAFLDEACAGDAAQRLRVDSLLWSHVSPDSFLAGMPPASSCWQGRERIGPDRRP